LLTSAPCAVIVECPHREVGGKTTPWAELVALSAACREAGVALHCDGARLWEAAAAYDKSLAEICALFDSVYVSFYKGLGRCRARCCWARPPSSPPRGRG